MLEEQDKYKGSVFILGGDFNLPDIEWPSGLVTGHSVPSHVTDTIINMADDLSLSQMVDFHTRKEHTLDLVFTSHPSLVNKCKCLPPLGKSDHDIVLIDTLITPQRSKPTRRKIHIWDKADHDSIRKDLSDFTQTFTSHTYTDIDNMWNTIRDFTTNLIHKHVPSKMTSSRSTNPWANRHIARLSRRKQRAHKKAKRTKHNRDWARYKSLQAETQREVRRAHDTYMDEIIGGDMRENPKRLWSYLKSRKQDTSGVSPLKTLRRIPP